MTAASRTNCHTVSITVAGEIAADAIEFLFDQFDSLATEIDLMNKADNGYARVVGYFAKLPDTGEFDIKLQLALAALGLNKDAVVSIDEKTIEQTDWLQEWKKHWHAERVGRFVIAPAWEKIEDNRDEIVIRIEPGMAFGTGTHETTRLCLKAIDENYRLEMSVLDVGTGTGILAIAAAKMQAQATAPILACDVDEDAVRIARENAVANGIADKIEFVVGAISESTPAFDFICANLTLDVITPLLPLLLEKTRRVLVLSGILVEQRTDIITEIKKFKLTNPYIEAQGEWISIVICIT